MSRLSHIACIIYGFLGGVFGFNSINTAAWISVDRYNVISKPLEALRKVTHRRAAMQILLVWAWALGWALPPLFGWGAYIPEGFQTTCTFDYLTRTINNVSYVWAMFAAAFVAPVLIIIYCYVNIVRAVAAQAKEMQKTAEKMGAKMSKTDNARRQELATAKIVAGTICLFVLSWVAYVVVALAGILGYRDLVTPYTSMVPVMIAKTSPIWNPMVYALSHPKFRAALEEHFPW